MMFGPSPSGVPDWGTMASADFCMFNAPSRRRLPTIVGVPCRPPRVRAVAFVPCTCPIYCCTLWLYGASPCAAGSPKYNSLKSGSCTSGRDFAAGFLQIPPRGGHPCLRLTVGTANPRSGLSPYSYRPCRAHREKKSKACSPYSFFKSVRRKGSVLNAPESPVLFHL